MRGIRDGAMHVVAGIRNDLRKYGYKGQSLNGKGLIKALQREGNKKMPEVEHKVFRCDSQLRRDR